MKCSRTIYPATAIVVTIATGINTESVNANIFSNENVPSLESCPLKAQTDSSGINSVGIKIGNYKEWNRKLERRFDELIVKTYNKTASEEEYLEFEDLQRAREQFKSPMSADEIIAEMNREEAANKLISALENYRKYVG